MINYDNTKTYYDLMRHDLEDYGDRPFIRWEEDDVIHDRTFKEFVTDGFAVAAWANEMSARAGHTIHGAFVGSASYEYLSGFLGIMAGGAVAIPLDPQLTVEELVDHFSRSDTDYVFCDESVEKKVNEAVASCPGILRVFSLNPSVRDGIMEIFQDYHEKPFEAVKDENEMAMILYTSGTTGKSKGVMLSHRNLLNNLFIRELEPNHDTDVYMNILPVHHVFAQNADVLFPMWGGSVLALNRDMAKLSAHLKLFHPTVICIVPMIAKALMNRFLILQQQHPEMSVKELKIEVYGVKLERITCGGGYLSPELYKKYKAVDILIGQGYGLSEFAPTISTTDYFRPDKCVSVGKIVPRCQVRIVDGEIQAKSPSIMLGYYKEPERTAEVITEDGFLKTGDLGYFDEEGYLYLTGRIKNLIILSNGENVSAEQLENLFENDRLVAEVVCYGKDDQITAEIYPNMEYAKQNAISDIRGQLEKIIADHNTGLATYKRIQHLIVRTAPFEKTSSRKIKRQHMNEMPVVREEEKKVYRLPENSLQQKIYDIACGILGHKKLGIDTNLFETGMDSLGAIMMLSSINDEFGLDYTLDELMAAPTVELLAISLDERTDLPEVDYSVREVYPLTNLQKYFAYIIRGNTTGNLPFLYELGESVDLIRLKAAIEEALNVHPELKGVIMFSDGAFRLFRRDDAEVSVAMMRLTDAEFEEKKAQLVVPYGFTKDEPLYHITLFETPTKKYLFLDIAHIMGDGVSIKVIMEDINRIYRGEELPVEQYTFYEYILDEVAREERGKRADYISYYEKTLEDLEIDKSILTGKNQNKAPQNIGATLDGILSDLKPGAVAAFCKENGITENVLFTTAFNYCVSIYRNDPFVVSSSIHSGRIDSRWQRVTGPLFITYYTSLHRYAHETTAGMLNRSARHMMDDMRQQISCVHPDELLFQYQGDLLSFGKIAGAPAKLVPLPMDATPCHLQIFKTAVGYKYQLRFMPERMDEEQLKVFLLTYEGVIAAMINGEPSARRLLECIPDGAFPKKFELTAGEINKAAGYELVAGVTEDTPIRTYVLDRNHAKQPYGAWGEFCLVDYPMKDFRERLRNPKGTGFLYKSGLTARILTDGTLDFVKNSGRLVETERITNRVYYDLEKIEEELLGIDGVRKAYAYLAYNPAHYMDLACTIYTDRHIDEEMVKERIAERFGKEQIPYMVKAFRIG
ncbi:MAG: AMP-binding protein [Lachnospiraceae bacterium]|nr:AMP-binding protein [Lachnospiraceae bacterium]